MAPPWEALNKIDETIRGFIETTGEEALAGETMEEISIQEIRDQEGRVREKMIVIHDAVCVKRAILFRDLGIYIGVGTLLEPTAVIKAPALIGENCEVRQGAYCRGRVIVGDHSVVGHVTEVKNSIIMNHSEAGHFAYIGDSIIGSHVNLGAGTKLANLRFRSSREKELGSRADGIRLGSGQEILDTGLRKLGAVIGDYSELGCNSVTSPGTLLKHGCWVYPGAVVGKGIHPSGSKIHHPSVT